MGFEPLDFLLEVKTPLLGLFWFEPECHLRHNLLVKASLASIPGQRPRYASLRQNLLQMAADLILARRVGARRDGRSIAGEEVGLGRTE